MNKEGRRPRNDEEVIGQFWLRVDKPLGWDCWIWTGCKNKAGYGRMFLRSIKTRSITTHRFSYLISKGVIPEGMLVCHRCDNPSCVNPNHLFLGTHRDNVRDCMEKGRRRKTPPNAKINQKLAVCIRNEYPHINQRELCKKYSLSTASISRIINFKAWINCND